MRDLDSQPPTYFLFDPLGSIHELPPLQDNREFFDHQDQGSVEPFWSGMLEQSFEGISKDVQRTQGGGCAIAWIPPQDRREGVFSAIGGVYPWTTVRSLVDGTAEGTITFRSYMQGGVPGLTPDLECLALEWCNRWNAARCWPQAALVEWNPEGGPTCKEIILSCHLQVCFGTFQPLVDKFIDDAMKGADEFWSVVIAEWPGCKGTIQ